MALFTRTDARCFVALFFALGSLFFIPLLAGLPGYMTTSARTPFCRAHLPGPELCPLDYVMLAGHVLQAWAVFMLKFMLPIMLAGAVCLVTVRWMIQWLSQRRRGSANG